LAREELDNVAAFKEIVSNAPSFAVVQTRLHEIQELGPEYVEGFHYFAQWLEIVGAIPGVYRQNSLWYEMTAVSSIHILFKLAVLNSMLVDYERKPKKFQTFPIRHSFIPTYVQFDFEGVAKQILGLSVAQSREAGRDQIGQNFGDTTTSMHISALFKQIPKDEYSTEHFLRTGMV
jgi:hypothetical protein